MIQNYQILLLLDLLCTEQYIKCLLKRTLTMNNVSLLIVFCNISIILCWTVDYFAGDFDENANCKNEDKVKDLNKKGYCAKISRG